jgi:hypothetical protein
LVIECRGRVAINSLSSWGVATNRGAEVFLTIPAKSPDTSSLADTAENFKTFASEYF